jgi:hypothetical protein
MANDSFAPLGGRNRLLSALPADVVERLQPHVEVVDLALRQGRYAPNEPSTHA